MLWGSLGPRSKGKLIHKNICVVDLFLKNISTTSFNFDPSITWNYFLGIVVDRKRNIVLCDRGVNVIEGSKMYESSLTPLLRGPLCTGTTLYFTKTSTEIQPGDSGKKLIQFQPLY